MNWLEDIELDELGTMYRTAEDEEQLKERFKITDLNSLNWALRKLTALGKSHAEEFEVATMEIKRIEDWFKKQDEAYQYSKSLLEGLVKDFAKAQRVIDPKWRQSSPYGAVGFRKQKKYDYGDEEKLVQFLDENGMSDYVKVVKSPRKTELKKALAIVDGKAVFTDTGEILPITVEEVEDVTIKLEG